MAILIVLNQTKDQLGRAVGGVEALFAHRPTKGVAQVGPELQTSFGGADGASGVHSSPMDLRLQMVVVRSRHLQVYEDVNLVPSLAQIIRRPQAAYNK